MKEQREYTLYYYERDGIDPADLIGTINAIDEEEAIQKGGKQYSVYGADIIAKPTKPHPFERSTMPRVILKHCSCCGTGDKEVKAITIATAINARQTVAYCKDCAYKAIIFLIEEWI